jgi:DNA-binding response OmpR family regulator
MASILLVEDEADLRRLLCTVVEDAGYRVECVGRFAEALNHLKSGTFDLLVADVGLPDGSGFDLAEKAKELGKKALLVTGYPHFMDHLDERGAPYLRKPFRLEELVSSISRFVGPPPEPSTATC